MIKLRAKVNVTLDVYEYGELVLQEKRHNLVVDAGLNWLIHCMAGSTGYTPLTKLYMGLDDTAPTANDTALGWYAWSDNITEFQYAGSTLTVKYYLSSLNANGNTLKEAGLFDSFDHMFARVVHTPIVKSSSTGIVYTWEITLDVV